MPGIVIDSCDDRPYGPGNPDYEFEKYRDEQDEKEGAVMTADEDNMAKEVSLIEQLRSVPKDFRTSRAIQWDEGGREIGHQFIPVGFMMHRAADELEAALQAKEGLIVALRDLRKMCDPNMSHQENLMVRKIDAAIDQAMAQKE